MPVLTTPATYHQGIVIPKIKPHFGEPDEVVVTFVKIGKEKEERHKAKGNAPYALAVLEQLRGLLPKDFPDGGTYIRKLRDEMDKEFDDRLKRLGIV